MTRRNSEADSIVWIEEGKQQDRVVSVWIHAPKTILVFGIFIRTRLRPGLLPRPAVDSSEAYFFKTLKVFRNL
jgi:hypothetical protein